MNTIINVIGFAVFTGCILYVIYCVMENRGIKKMSEFEFFGLLILLLCILFFTFSYLEKSNNER